MVMASTAQRIKAAPYYKLQEEYNQLWKGDHLAQKLFPNTHTHTHPPTASNTTKITDDKKAIGKLYNGIYLKQQVLRVRK